MKNMKYTTNIFYFVLALTISSSVIALENTCTDLGTKAPTQIYDCTLESLSGGKKCCYVSVTIDEVQKSACVAGDLSTDASKWQFYGDMAQLGPDATVDCSGSINAITLLFMSLFVLVLL